MLYCFKSVAGSTGTVQHSHEFHEFFVCLTPQTPNPALPEAATHYVENLTIATYPGDVFFFPAGQPHLCVSRHPGGCPNLVLYITGDTLSVTGSGDREALNILNALEAYTTPGKNSLPFAPAAKENIRDIFLAIEGECVERKAGYNCATKEKLLALLLLLYRQWGGQEKLAADLADSKTNERVQDGLHFIEAQYMNQLGVEDLLRVCCMSRSHFHAIFKEEVGCTFKEHLTRVRVLRATGMLQSSDLPLAQIALACGFSSQSRFNHVFKAITGRTPRDERLMYRSDGGYASA